MTSFATAALAARACGYAAKSLHSAGGLRGPRQQRAAKGKIRTCDGSNILSRSQSATHDHPITASTNGFRGVA